jgi:sugar phosphate isomerase/epimerase
MRLLLVRHLWGLDLSEGYVQHIVGWRKTGYTALETASHLIPNTTELRRVLKGEGFDWMPQVFSNEFAGRGGVKQHLDSMRRQMEPCLDAEPMFFNAHSSSDACELDEAEEFYLRCAELEAELGVAMSHETHRSRSFGSPWNIMRLLERVAEVKLMCDFSHWVCVAERLL